MTGTIAQVRPADERLAERLAEEYRQARIDWGRVRRRPNGSRPC